MVFLFFPFLEDFECFPEVIRFYRHPYQAIVIVMVEMGIMAKMATIAVLDIIAIIAMVALHFKPL